MHFPLLLVTGETAVVCNGLQLGHMTLTLTCLESNAAVAIEASMEYRVTHNEPFVYMRSKQSVG